MATLKFDVLLNMIAGLEMVICYFAWRLQYLKKPLVLAKRVMDSNYGQITQCIAAYAAGMYEQLSEIS
jgi:hypothetical protein